MGRGICDHWQDCSSFKQLENCGGCSFQHFEKILKGHKNNKTLQILGDSYFRLISERRKGIGGRIALDKPMRDLFRTQLPELEVISSRELKVKLFGKDFKPKADGAFRVKNSKNTCIFYELKGYGDNTNDVLSAISAAQLLKEVPKFKNSFYYYLGSSRSNKYPFGLERKSFFENKKIGVAPYVKWAENKGFLKFYGIADIESFLDEVRSHI